MFELPCVYDGDGTEGAAVVLHPADTASQCGNDSEPATAGVLEAQADAQQPAVQDDSVLWHLPLEPADQLDALLKMACQRPSPPML
eukprot:2886298-Prorocentrum_lima.AAC.1